MNNPNQNDEKSDSSVVSSSEESDDESAKSIPSGNENNRAAQMSRHKSNIDQVLISSSNDVTIGNRIHYHGPVVIHQQQFNQNQNNNQNQFAEVINQQGNYHLKCFCFKFHK